MNIRKLELKPVEFVDIEILLNKISVEFICCHNEFLDQAPLLAHKLPTRLLEFVYKFKTSISDRERGCIISNLPTGNIGLTPSYAPYKPFKNTRNVDILLTLIGALVGSPFGWRNEQSGSIIHDVIPVYADKDKQASTSPNKEICWHTEEAFHLFPPDYIGLFCLRNDAGIATNYLSINSLDLTDKIFDILFKHKYDFTMLDSHDFSEPTQVWSHSVLFGDRGQPFIRIDPYFMITTPNNTNQSTSLQALIKKINSHIKKLVLSKGELLLLDNLQCVHGRESLNASFNGNDRWLKRIYISRDLYKYKNGIGSIDSRVF